MVAIVIFNCEKPSQDESTWTESRSILQFLWVASQNIIQNTIFKSTYDEKADTWQELRSLRYILDDQEKVSSSSSSRESMISLSSLIQA